ncbi:hypothetical protein PVAP13_8KG311808 [Panicum virgatum]|uniref:Uncharacterized protein n=1 Tax=Panicum virgatum TaxID=38727 RepID=A0A8T0PSG0_PANVG|nr:hypothetical protein PVAP13_8KG311808 [Panicum virgatum]
MGGHGSTPRRSVPITPPPPPSPRSGAPGSTSRVAPRHPPSPSRRARRPWAPGSAQQEPHLHLLRGEPTVADPPPHLHHSMLHGRCGLPLLAGGGGRRARQPVRCGTRLGQQHFFAGSGGAQFVLLIHSGDPPARPRLFSWTHPSRGAMGARSKSPPSPFPCCNEVSRGEVWVALWLPNRG